MSGGWSRRLVATFSAAAGRWPTLPNFHPFHPFRLSPFGLKGKRGSTKKGEKGEKEQNSSHFKDRPTNMACGPF
jgi:hypothetical protein